MDCNNNHRDESINEIAKEYLASKGERCNLFENPDFMAIFEGAIRPGGIDITKRAIELAGLKKGDRVLDVGCGYGITVELLRAEYGIEAEGVDISTTLLERGKKRNPKLNIAFGDGEMLDYPSLTFDGIFMECVLSLIDKNEEAIHEAYCLLKKGGKLIISDFYEKDPLKALDSHELAGVLSDSGFDILYLEDKDKELKEFTASLIMHYGSLEAFFDSADPCGNDKSPFNLIRNQKKVGYHLLIAEKNS